MSKTYKVVVNHNIIKFYSNFYKYLSLFSKIFLSFANENTNENTNKKFSYDGKNETERVLGIAPSG